MKPRDVVSYLSALIACLLMTAAVHAELSTPSVFGDHMVLQRQMPVPVWGKADPGQSVSVRVNDKTATTKADATGKWMVKLEAGDAGGPYEMKITAGGETLTFSDVHFGEVWLCSGQSNMDMRLEKVMNADKEVAAADHPGLRLFRVERAMSDDMQADAEARWAACTPEEARKFSAAAYFMGRQLHESLGVPVGLIHCAYGGTPAEAWTSMPALRSEPDLDWVLAKQRAKEQQYEHDLAAYKRAVAAGDASANEPASLMDRHNPAVLFNAMLHPLIPYAVRGAAWYQGESNVWQGAQYRLLLATMINDWRDRWDRPDMPFGVVQLPNYVNPPRVPRGDFSWPELRESQALVAKDLPNIGLIVTIDIGDPTDIHPLNKQEVGRRLALWAMSTVYDQPVTWTGPVYREARFEGDKVRLSFDHVGSGFMTRDGGPIKGFVIAGPDQKFRWARVEIDGDELIVSEVKVPMPLAVRYAWDENPYWANLVNTEGLPAAPFRTDDWPGITEGQ